MIKPKEPTQPPDDDDVIVIIDPEEIPKPKFCAATSKSGKPCARPPMRGQTLCSTHHPASKEQNRTTVQKMNEARRERKVLSKADFLPDRLETPDDLLDTVRGVLKQLFSGKVQPKVATAAFYGINAACRIQDGNKKNETLAKLKIKFGPNGERETELTIEGVLAQIQKLAS